MVAHEAFFQRRQAAAVLKHGILSRYPRMFATMAGKRTGRVVYLDGYAGPGRYDDGASGSPLLAVETARATARWDRNVECLFVEKDPDYAANLERTLAEAAPELMAYQVWLGDVSDYVDRALEIAGDDPMFTFLDPFGTALSYDNLTGRLLGRAQNKPTEVLLNLSLQGVWRIGGLLTGDSMEDGAEVTLARLDGFFGDTWWREEFRRARASEDQGSAADAALRVANEFQKRVGAATGFDSFGVQVRRRPGHKPLFLMLLFFRHWKAPWKFNEAVSSANDEWREACWRQDLDDMQSEIASSPEDLFGELTPQLVEEAKRKSWTKQQQQMRDSWVQIIEGNLAALLVADSPVQLGQRVKAVYGETLGLAREMDVRRAWDALSAAGGATSRDKSVRHLEEAWLSRGST